MIITALFESKTPLIVGLVALTTLLGQGPTAFGQNQKIYWVDPGLGVIDRCNFNGTGQQTVFSEPTLGNAVAVDDIGGKIYWGQAGPFRIRRANFDGTGVEDIVSSAQALTVVSIGVDVLAGKLYWVDIGITPGFSHIMRADLDGSNVQTILVRNGSVAGLRLDTAAGKLYWTNFTPADKIRRANLDGTNVEDVVATASSCRGFALDTAAGKIYWTDLGINQIKRADLTGANVQTLVTAGPALYGIDLDLAAGKMIWAELGKIRRANLDGTGAVDVLTGLSSPREVKHAFCTLAPLATTTVTSFDIVSCPHNDGDSLTPCPVTVTVVDAACNPIVGVPATDIWLESFVPGDLTLCATVPADAATNVNGQTMLTMPLRASGWTGKVSGGPNCNDGLRVFVSGLPVPAPPLPIRVRSPDYNGDLLVDSLDQTNFLQVDYANWINNAVLDCRSDFNSDGLLNLVDIGIFAFHSGHGCP